MIPGAALARGTRKSPRRSFDPAPSRGSLPQSKDRPYPETRPSLCGAFMPTPIASENRWRLFGRILSDIALIVGGWNLLMAGLRFETLGDPAISGWQRTYEWPGMAFVFAVLTTLLGYSEGLYTDARKSTPAQRDNVILFKATLWAAAICCLEGALSNVRGYRFYLVVPCAALNLATLALWHQWRRNRRARTSCKQPVNVLIVGAGPRGHSLAGFLRENPEHGRVVRGFLDDRSPLGFGVLGRTADLGRVARAEFADEVILATDADADRVRQITEQALAHHLDVLLAPELPLALPKGLRWMRWDSVPVFTLHREPVPAGSLVLKRCMDAVIGGLALIILIPTLVGIAACIWMDSKGPILYAAPRIGRKGRKFVCYKFRTMIRGADSAREKLRSINEREGPCFKLRNDPRVTRVGRFLRRYSLDELPQLWNVVRGEMSLVGPRPHPVDDCSRYELAHLRRLDVTPGLTGLWQVSARQSASFARNLELDLEYIENWTLGLDVRILLQTVAVVLRGTGA